ncbi:MAG: shikimate dehydrogenase [Candidatus Methanomethylophilaceae archaeon]|jgi:shikimate dehydrogenase|nr:shikimate dehydrogenase [Candidatus Methanomethylophilaceae archaeon]NLF34139.1 shikimate dehydrogenase [Thermoplasmatales archaeon]
MMRICASLGGIRDADDLSDADMAEIRTDILDSVPDIDGKELLVTFRDGIDLSFLPDGYEGMLDIGISERPDTGSTIISSYHDYASTPSWDAIVSQLDVLPGDIVKGAYSVHDFTDLNSIFRASRELGRRHVLLGMGEAGTVTRIRSSLLGNEFTFGYVSTPTAPGQMSVSEMRRLGDDCLVTGIVGRPLDKSASPVMHAAAMGAAGIDGAYLRFDVPRLDGIDDALRDYRIRGINVTIPYKTSILPYLDRLDPLAASIGAVNTVVNEGGRLVGHNTDVEGVRIAMEHAGICVRDRRALVMGTGGAARACIGFLTGEGCDVTVTGRNAGKAAVLAGELGCSHRNKDSAAVAMYDIIVNCTPVGMYGEGEYPVSIDRINRDHSVFDMVYGKDTDLILAARAAGARTATGADMLAGQGSASFKLWTGVPDMFETMRKAIT